jgi:hypothetical protein
MTAANLWGNFSRVDSAQAQPVVISRKAIARINPSRFMRPSSMGCSAGDLPWRHPLKTWMTSRPQLSETSL